MAKRASTDRDEKVTAPKLEAFAEDLGRLLGSAQAKANHWLGQRQEIVKHLTGVRDTAAKLLADLGHKAERVNEARKRVAGTSPVKRKRRKLSAAARKAISDAQKKRWAALKAKGRK